MVFVLGIGLMIATALENNGATVYIVSKRQSVLEEAARKHNVSIVLTAISLGCDPDPVGHHR